ncbi:MAG: GNAT family N-acetyltransferase [Candidatus Rokuibacteriota bacterium]
MTETGSWGAAIELYDGAALLRSVAVEAERRGEGLGQNLTRAALELARERGAKTVYLLDGDGGRVLCEVRISGDRAGRGGAGGQAIGGVYDRVPRERAGDAPNVVTTPTGAP